MKNARNLNLDPEILMRIDFDNSVNGGASATDIQVTDVADGYRMLLKVPGVEADDMRVEVVNSRLLIYHHFPVYGQSDLLPNHYKSIRVIGNFVIPTDADAEKVSAAYDTSARHLEVFLPYTDEEQKNFRTKVAIDKR